MIDSVLDTVIGASVANGKDLGLPKEFSNDIHCKILNLNCSKLSSDCYRKLGSLLRKSSTAKKCLKKLSRSERKKKIKSYCQQTCTERGRQCFKSVHKNLAHFTRLRNV